MNSLFQAFLLLFLEALASFGGKLHRHYADLKMLGIPSLLRKESLLDGLLCCKFCLDIER